MSITAAIGIPKFDAGPQKSIIKNSRQYMSLGASCDRHDFAGVISVLDREAGMRSRDLMSCLGAIITQATGVLRTGRTEVVSRWIRANLCIEGFDCGGHG